MSTTAIPPKDNPPPLPVRRFTVEEYQRMGELGFLTPADRVELLEGWIVPKMVHNAPHDAAIQIVAAALRGVLPAGWCDRIQCAVNTGDSALEPDVAIVRGDVRTYVSRHPQPDDVGFLVEVADSSLERDRGPKARIYARARIAVYWIVNLIDRQIEVYTQPSGDVDEPQYRQTQIYGLDDILPVVLDGNEVATFDVSGLLP